MIKTINWPSLNLSETQSAKLKARLKEVVRYLLKPNFQDYYRLKTKGLHYKFSPTGLASNLLAEANLDIAREPNPELRQVQRLWSHVHNRGGKEFVPELSAISLESVAAAISHTNSGQALLSGQVKRGFTIAVEALDPGFEYSPKARTNDDPLLLFDLGFMAKSAKTGKVGPMHLSLVWLEEDEDWALNRLIIDLWLGFWTLF